jgi:hypothetical protein
MNAAKPSKPSEQGAKLFRTALAHREAILCAALVALTIGGAVWAWRQWGAQIQADPLFTIRPEHIEINAPPAWVRSDIKAEVVRDGSLDQLPLLDSQTTIKVARALETHPWIAKVLRVTKQPGPRILAEVEYRRPVALVEVSADGERGLLPVDGAGVVLPSDDFLDEQQRLMEFATRLPRIDSQGVLPAGLVGAAWGDRRVEGAAKVAAALGEHWEKLGFYRIVAEWAGAPPSQTPRPIYRLVTREKDRDVVWRRPR